MKHLIKITLLTTIASCGKSTVPTEIYGLPNAEDPTTEILRKHFQESVAPTEAQLKTKTWECSFYSAMRNKFEDNRNIQMTFDIDSHSAGTNFIVIKSPQYSEFNGKKFRKHPSFLLEASNTQERRFAIRYYSGSEELVWERLSGSTEKEQYEGNPYEEGNALPSITDPSRKAIAYGRCGVLKTAPESPQPPVEEVDNSYEQFHSVFYHEYDTNCSISRTLNLGLDLMLKRCKGKYRYCYKTGQSFQYVKRSDAPSEYCMEKVSVFGRNFK